MYLTVATINLANYRPISGDDAWILSASYKLARQGVFGSDMFAGFFNADQHYFIALPGQHVLQAAALWLWGDGVAQARWVSVLSGAALLWAASLLAWRWYGVTAAILTGLLLMAWQPMLVGDEGVPLVSLGRSLRYDLSAVAWTWLALLFLGGLLSRPGRGRALATGLCAAAATLTQFFGVFAAVVVGLAWVGQQRRRVLVNPCTRWLVAGFALPLLPYLWYVGAHWSDAVGQTVYLKWDRAAFDLDALARNLMREPRRFKFFLDQAGAGAGPWLLLLGIGPALACLLLRLRRDGARGDRLLALTLAVTLLLLSLIDATKAPIYALPLLPAFCLLLALLLGQTLHWAWSHPRPLGWVLGAATIAALGLVIRHSVDFYRRDRAQALTVSDYEALGEKLAAALPAGAHVAGTERWWWPLRAHPYLALNNLAGQWLAQRDRTGQTPSLADVMAQNDVEYLLMSRNAPGDMKRYAGAVEQQFWAFMDRCTMRREKWQDPWYGELSLHAVRPGCHPAVQNTVHDE